MKYKNDKSIKLVLHLARKISKLSDMKLFEEDAIWKYFRRNKDLYDDIFDALNIPEETETFCRDPFTDLLFDCLREEISITYFLNKIDEYHSTGNFNYIGVL